LVVVEGADAPADRRRLRDWSSGWNRRTRNGAGRVERSTLVSEELEKAQEGNILSRTTLSLFYATDFAISWRTYLPALKAGSS